MERIKSTNRARPWILFDGFIELSRSLWHCSQSIALTNFRFKSCYDTRELLSAPTQTRMLLAKSVWSCTITESSHSRRSFIQTVRLVSFRLPKFVSRCPSHFSEKRISKRLTFTPSLHPLFNAKLPASKEILFSILTIPLITHEVLYTDFCIVSSSFKEKWEGNWLHYLGAGCTYCLYIIFAYIREAIFS